MRWGNPPPFSLQSVETNQSFKTGICITQTALTLIFLLPSFRRWFRRWYLHRGSAVVTVDSTSPPLLPYCQSPEKKAPRLDSKLPRYFNTIRVTVPLLAIVTGSPGPAVSDEKQVVLQELLKNHACSSTASPPPQVCVFDWDHTGAFPSAFTSK